MQDYLVDGITDALITKLAQTSSARVISRMSVLRYKSAATERLPEIARELNVDAIVEGSVARAGSQVRITTQLVDPRSARQPWARSYERELDELDALQTEVAQALGEAVTGKMILRSTNRVGELRRINPDAYELFFKGLVAAGSETVDGFRNAVAYSMQAVERDPTFATAYARMGFWYEQYAFFGNVPPTQVMPQVEEAARKAIAMDDGLAEAHAVLETSCTGSDGNGLPVSANSSAPWPLIRTTPTGIGCFRHFSQRPAVTQTQSPMRAARANSIPSRNKQASTLDKPIERPASTSKRSMKFATV
ncbi:MAG TPA: hypothetical protein VFU28_03115 [Vicinamibacterales bacterium]|nr:hypothetical protein [Vicinamibacterales bacterium]